MYFIAFLEASPLLVTMLVLLGAAFLGKVSADCAWTLDTCVEKNVADILLNQDHVNALQMCQGQGVGTCEATSYMIGGESYDCKWSTALTVAMCTTTQFDEYYGSELGQTFSDCSVLEKDACDNEAKCEFFEPQGVSAICLGKEHGTEIARCAAIMDATTCVPGDTNNEDDTNEEDDTDDMDVELAMKCMTKLMDPLFELMECNGVDTTEMKKQLEGVQGGNRRRLMDETMAVMNDPDTLCSDTFKDCLEDFAVGLSALQDDEECKEFFGKALKGGEDAEDDGMLSEINSALANWGTMCMKNEDDDYCMETIQPYMEGQVELTCENIAKTKCCGPTIIKMVVDCKDNPMYAEDGDEKTALMGARDQCTDVAWDNYCGGASDPCKVESPPEILDATKAMKGEDVRESVNNRKESAGVFQTVATLTTAVVAATLLL